MLIIIKKRKQKRNKKIKNQRNHYKGGKTQDKNLVLMETLDIKF